jgi:hypothetical protein
LVCAAGRTSLDARFSQRRFCIEAFGRFHAAENAPLVRRIHPALPAINPDADPSTWIAIIFVQYVADWPDEKCWSPRLSTFVRRETYENPENRSRAVFLRAAVRF